MKFSSATGNDLGITNSTSTSASCGAHPELYFHIWPHSVHARVSLVSCGLGAGRSLRSMLGEVSSVHAVFHTYKGMLVLGGGLAG